MHVQTFGFDLLQTEERKGVQKTKPIQFQYLFICSFRKTRAELNSSPWWVGGRSFWSKDSLLYPGSVRKSRLQLPPLWSWGRAGPVDGWVNPAQSQGTWENVCVPGTAHAPPSNNHFSIHLVRAGKIQRNLHTHRFFELSGCWYLVQERELLSQWGLSESHLKNRRCCDIFDHLLTFTNPKKSISSLRYSIKTSVHCCQKSWCKSTTTPQYCGVIYNWSQWY